MGVGIPIPVLNSDILKAATVKDSEIYAQVIDYSHDYPQKTGKVIASVTYEELKSGKIHIDGKEIETGALSSYSKAREIAALLQDEIRRGDFFLKPPIAPLPVDQSMQSLTIREPNDGT